MEKSSYRQKFPILGHDNVISGEGALPYSAVVYLTVVCQSQKLR